MENKIFIKRLKEIKEIKLIKHKKSNRINAECITRKPHHRRKNVVGDINPTGNYFTLYKDGKWISKSRLGIKTIDEAIDWVKADIERLSR